MPLGDGISFKYGSYEFDPRPLFTVNKEMIKTASNSGLGTKYSLTLNGNILPTGVALDDAKGGLTQVFSGTDALRDAFAQDFNLLILQCDTDSPLISGHPKIISVDVNHASDNYIQRADYTINLELPSLTGAGYDVAGVSCYGTEVGNLSSSGLISVSDEVTIEFLDERVGGDIAIASFGSIPSVFSIQRTVSAQGDSLCTGEIYTEPWERAKAYVANNLGLTPEMTGLTDLMCVGNINVANNFRNISINKTEGSVNATETWIAYTGATASTEEFEISIEKSMDQPLTSISINGTLQGLTDIGYDACSATGAPKFNNALAGWSGVSGLLYSRAQSVYNSLPNSKGNPTGLLNIDPLSESIGYNIIGGTVTYNHSYDDRPDNMYTGALTETISLTYNEPTDVFASLTVLGKARGPLFQDIYTSGVTTRDISIDAIIRIEGDNTSNRFTAPPTIYDNFVNNYEASLTSVYGFNQVFVSSHSKSWEPKVGHFTLSKSWTVGYCI